MPKLSAASTKNVGADLAAGDLTAADLTAKVDALNGAAQALLKTDAAGALQLVKSAQLAAGEEYLAGLAQSLLLEGVLLTEVDNSEESVGSLGRALCLFRTLDNQKKARECLIHLGRIRNRMGDFLAARDDLSSALELTGGDDPEAAEIHNLLAGIHHANGEYDLSLKSLKDSLRIHEANGNDEQIANVLNNLGIIYTSLGIYPEALASISEAYKISRDIPGGGRLEGLTLINLGSLYLDMNEIAKAVAYFQEALQIGLQGRDLHTVATARLNIAEAQLEQQNYPEAEAAYREALATSREIQYRTGEISALVGLGRLHARRGRFAQAAASYTGAVTTARETGDLEGELDALHHLGEVQAELGEPGAALASLERALTLAQEADHKKAVYEAHRALAGVYKRAGEFGRALHHHELYHQAERALFNEESDRKTGELSAQFDVERARHEAEVQRLQREMADSARAEAEALVRERTAELEQAQVEIVTRLAVAAEYRDDLTGEHTWRVGHVSALIARELGLPEGDVALLRIAARLHDVGKIGIPDAILLKPGRFTPEEFERMKAHTLIGARILSGGHSRLLRMAEEIALSHHERWDGSGYPLGQTGQGIPVTGRIVAVADVFDALTSERPYKRAWTREEALAELQRQAGRQFDPEVVRAGVRVFALADFPITAR